MGRKSRKRQVNAKPALKQFSDQGAEDEQTISSEIQPAEGEIGQNNDNQLSPPTMYISSPKNRNSATNTTLGLPIEGAAVVSDLVPGSDSGNLLSEDRYDQTLQNNKDDGAVMSSLDANASGSVFDSEKDVPLSSACARDSSDEKSQESTKTSRTGENIPMESSPLSSGVNGSVNDEQPLGDQNCESQSSFSRRTITAQSLCEFTAFKDRLGTFFKFPGKRLAPLNAKTLAAAGFVHLPDKFHFDRCVCFSCHLALHSWKSSDDPMYEHTKRSSECHYVQAVLTDNVSDLILDEEVVLEDTLAGADPRTSTPDAHANKNSESYSDPLNQENWNNQTVLDHLIIVVHGVGTDKAIMSSNMASIRHTVQPLFKRHFPHRRLCVAYEAVDWQHIIHENVFTQNSECKTHSEMMQAMTLPNLQSIRAVAGSIMLECMHYATPEHCSRILTYVANKANGIFESYAAKYPRFSGKVSFLGHSLGSVVCYDILCRQHGVATKEFCPVGLTDSECKPQLAFEVHNLFICGSPLGMFLSARATSLPKPFVGPSNTRLFNVFHPLDLVAYRLDPLLISDFFDQEEPPIELPTCSERLKQLNSKRQSRRGSTGSTRTPEKDAKTDQMDANKRIVSAYSVNPDSFDFVLKKESKGIQLSAAMAAIPAHWSYWDDEDFHIFMLDVIDHQQMEYDFFESREGKELLDKAAEILDHVDSGGGGDLIHKSEDVVTQVGQELVETLRKDPETRGLLGVLLPKQLIASDEGYVSALRELSQHLKAEKLLAEDGMLKKGQKITREAKARQDFLMNLRQTIVSGLLSYLNAVEIPTIAGSKQTAAGTFDYALGGIELSDISIPVNCVHVQVSGRRITVKLADSAVTLDSFTWIYKQRSFPYLQDNGTAHAKATDVSVWLEFIVEPSESSVNLEASSLITLSNFDLKLHGSGSAFVYNFLVGVFIERIRTAVEAALGDALAHHMTTLSGRIIPIISQHIEKHSVLPKVQDATIAAESKSTTLSMPKGQAQVGVHLPRTENSSENNHRE